MKDPDFFKSLRLPLLCSPKLDGIRAVPQNGILKSRKNIALPSLQAQEMFGKLYEFDGELIVGNETDFGVYNRTQSHVMSIDKPHPDLKFRVFDFASLDMAHEPFITRLKYAESLLNHATNNTISIIEHKMCYTIDDVLAYEEEQLKLGYEGIMMRDPAGYYKHGRGTFKEGLIYKLKRFADEEAEAVDFIEQVTNTNEDIRDNLGNAKRSTAKAGLVAAGTLGKIKSKWRDQILEVGRGSMTHAEAQEVWDNQEKYRGRLFTFRHFPHGAKDKPRMPRFHGWRDKMDM
jgi:DNA ligase-1